MNNQFEQDDNFVESYTQRRLLQNDTTGDLDLYYSKENVKTGYLYPLTTLSGDLLNNGITISNDKISLLCTTPDKVTKIKVYLSEDDDFDLLETMDPTSVSNKILKNSDTISFVSPDFPDVDVDYIYLLTFIPLEEDSDVNNMKLFLSKTIIPSNINGAECVFASITEFINSYKTTGIKIVLTEPITDKIKQINVISPIGTLIGNIKPINDDGRFPDLYPKNGTQVFPKLVFPFQVNPTLNLINYWASDQIIPISDIFNFLDSKNIKYNQSFSLSDFLKLGANGSTNTAKFNHATKITFNSKSQYSIIVADTIGGLNMGIKYNGWEAEQLNTFQFSVGGEIFASTSKAYKLSNSNAVVSLPYKWKINSIENLEITEATSTIASSAFDVLKLMVTESFWKDYEFQGATKYNNNNELVVDDQKIYALMEKYAQQDRYAVTTNNWLSWKRINNSAYVLQNRNIVKRIECAMTMLSGAFKSNFCINKGDNDDYKILLPYYFELQNSIDNPSGYVKYNDLVVKLKSEYFDFTATDMLPKKFSISNNQIHKLEINHYVFPEMTNATETASIPSSMPIDQNLANGEYSKYQVRQFSKFENDIDILKSEYGSTDINFNPLNSNYVPNNGEFVFENPQKIKELIISSFFGAGIWEIEFIDQADKTLKMSFNLFDKSDSTNNFINFVL